MPKKRESRPVDAPLKEDDFIKGAQVATSASIELTAAQQKEYAKLSNHAKAEYPLAAISLMEPKAISQLRDDKNAPRGFKAIALQFNRYEYDQLERAANSAGVSKNKLMREAVEAACKKILK